jgi:hypothetical protein
MAHDKFVGIQVSPISFVDEGIDTVLDTLQQRVGVNVLMIGTVSWLGLKVGRSISHKLDGFPDHGVPEPSPLQGGAYVKTRPEYYRKTIIDDYENRDPLMAGFDVLEQVIPAARARGMQVYSELMEPFFKYAGHGSVNNVAVPNLAQLMEVDFMGRLGSEPSTSNKDYRMWIRSMIEDQVRSYDLDGLMWCNERKSPLDQLITGGAPGDFSPDAWEEADRRGIDVERVRIAFREVYDFFQAARAGTEFVDGAFVEFWRVLLANPEVLLWERFWLERNKDLDRELYGMVKWCNPNLKFGLNVWNRNHFNFIRKAQWPWLEQTTYADWVKPITYQHQSGEIYLKEQTDFHKTMFRDLAAGVHPDHVHAPGPERGRLGRGRAEGHGPRHLRVRPVRGHRARRPRQGAGVHGARRRRPAHEAPTRPSAPPTSSTAASTRPTAPAARASSSRPTTPA